MQRNNYNGAAKFTLQRCMEWVGGSTKTAGPLTAGKKNRITNDRHFPPFGKTAGKRARNCYFFPSHVSAFNLPGAPAVSYSSALMIQSGPVGSDTFVYWGTFFSPSLLFPYMTRKRDGSVFYHIPISSLPWVPSSLTSWTILLTLCVNLPIKLVPVTKKEEDKGWDGFVPNPHMERVAIKKQTHRK